MRDIILNEAAKAADILSGKAKLDDVKAAISLLARYDVQAAKIDANTTKKHLKQVVKSLYPNVANARADRLIEHYVNHAHEYPLHTLNGVPITQAELDIVVEQNGVRAKCLTFALLALAKLDTIKYPAVDYWYSDKRWNELMKRANLTLCEDDMCHIIHLLYKNGHIGLAKRVDNCSMHVLFADTAGEPVMILNEQDFMDLGYCLRAYLGEKYTRCEECGRWVKQRQRGKPRRFCDDCSSENHKRSALASYHRRK